MHLALYRRFRPTKFEQIIGQDPIVFALTNQVKSGKIGHAYLFAGTRGVGKTSCAKIFARAINCKEPVNGSPCGKCDICKALDDPNNVDILEIDAASNNGVDEIRDLREKIKYPPIYGKYKVYIIDEVHMLSDSAFNALLKTLEEPPSHAVFILATTAVYKLPATILSRCMRFDFRLITKENLIKHLKYVFDTIKVEYDEQSVEMIALNAQGSVRDALSIADCVVAFCGKKITIDKVIEVLGTGDWESVFKLSDKIFEKDLGGVLDLIDGVYKSGKNLVAFGRDMAIHFKNLLVVKNCTDARKILSVPEESYKKLLEQAGKADVETLLLFMQKFSDVENELKYTMSPRTLIELTSLECASLGVKKN